MRERLKVARAVLVLLARVFIQPLVVFLEDLRLGMWLRAQKEKEERAEVLRQMFVKGRLDATPENPAPRIPVDGAQ